MLDTKTKPPGKATPPRTRPYTWKHVLRHIKRDYAHLSSLRAVARLYDVKHSVIHRALHGYEPKDPINRHKLGLSPMLPAITCPKCGIVHVRKTCPVKQKKSSYWDKYSLPDLAQAIKDTLVWVSVKKNKAIGYKPNTGYKERQ